MKRILRTSMPLLIIVCLFKTISLKAQTPKYLDPTVPVDQRVEDLLGRMTLEEKIGQMIQVDHLGFNGRPNDVVSYFIGSVYSGGASKTGDNKAQAWIALYDSLQKIALSGRLKIPIIYGLDCVHGNNDLLGTTIFPHNIGLGCTRNPDLVKRAEAVTAEETAAIGVDWTFAPCIAVPRNERWGRTYEGFGETPELAGLMGSAAVKGLQGDSLSGKTSILACVKHFLGDGGTLNGTDQGNTVADEETIRNLFLPGYAEAVKAGVGSIMVSYSSLNGLKMHANKKWITDVLKGELGFKGFVVSDQSGIDQITSDYKQCVETAINAGVDMVMMTQRYAEFATDVKALISEGKITQARLDDAVRRILTIKFKKGLFEQPYTDKTLASSIGSAEHRAVARECVRESIVLLKRKDGVLPLPKTNARILVAGYNADDIGNQCGGWTVSWQGASGNTTTGTTILEGMKKAAPDAKIDFSLTGDFTDTKADYSVVVIGELPYAEGIGDRTDLTIPKSDVELIKKMKSYGAPVVVILVSGRPLILEQILHFSDAIIAAWLPGTEGDGVSDVLFGDYKPKGLLSYSWPKNMAQIPINFGDEDYRPLYEYSYGITSFDNSPRGSSPQFLSAIVTPDGKHLELTFNKAMSDPSTSNAKFAIVRNAITFIDVNAKALLKPGDNTTIILEVDSMFNNRNRVKISYSEGTIQSADGGQLKPFMDAEVYNWTKPTAIKLPARISADSYSDMFGIQTEGTTDTDGGGIDVTSIDDGDWLEYTIGVDKTAYYYLSLRIASEFQQGNITLTSGTKTKVTRSLPATGSWNTWNTEKQLISLYAGEQTMKILATKGGFKLHWISIDNVSAVEKENNILPVTNCLEQNYPNPFNPSTEIKYSVKDAGVVTLRIFNSIGQEVKTLINEYHAPGNYRIKFDAASLTSGIYYYRLSGSDFLITKKMLLIK